MTAPHLLINSTFRLTAIDNGKMGNSSGQVVLSSREYLLKGRISTVDSLCTSSDKVFFILLTTDLNEEVNSICRTFPFGKYSLLKASRVFLSG